MYDELAKQFWEQGFLHLDNFFSQDMMSNLDKIIREHYGDSPAYFHESDFLEKSSTDVIPWFPQWDKVAEFDAIDNDERFLAITQAILGEKWRTLYCMCMFSKPFSKGQAWHQDCPPEDRDVYNLNRLVYTSDIDDKNGGQLVLVPGSHKRSRISPGPVDEVLPGQIIITPKLGDLVFLHGHCWHRVLPINDLSRLSTNYRCVPATAPDDVTDVSVYRNMVYRFSTSEIIETR